MGQLLQMKYLAWLGAIVTFGVAMAIPSLREAILDYLSLGAQSLEMLRDFITKLFEYIASSFKAAVS